MTNDGLPLGHIMITAERQRQIDAKGFTLAHDAAHAKRELLDAARAYLGAARFADRYHRPMDAGARQRDTYWPWDESWWKPSADPVPNLVKAGALIAAEIDRLNLFPSKYPAQTGEMKMTFWAKRADRHPNTPATVPDRIEVHTTYGPIEIAVTEDVGYVKSFHADLGRLIAETEAETTARLAAAEGVAG